MRAARKLYGRDEHMQLATGEPDEADDGRRRDRPGRPGKMITSHVDSAKLYDETGSTVMGLKPGMELSLLDLLYGLLLPSGNDAAIAIAEGIGGTEDKFVDLMNEKAESLALEDTHFTNSHGLYDNDLYSSAYDMAMLARYDMQNATLRQIVAAVSWQPNWDGPPVWNGNRFSARYHGRRRREDRLHGAVAADDRRIRDARRPPDHRLADAQPGPLHGLRAPARLGVRAAVGLPVSSSLVASVSRTLPRCFVGRSPLTDSRRASPPSARRGRWRAPRRASPAPRGCGSRAPSSSRSPVASVKTISPSLGVCAGRTARARPSWQTVARRFACSFVSAAFVATTTSTVFCSAISGCQMRPSRSTSTGIFDACRRRRARRRRCGRSRDR